MKVGELIDMLSDYDDAAEVRLMTQPSWPFEHSISGVVSRDEIECDPDDEPADASNAGRTFDGGRNGTGDVFILEGSQLCYGSKQAWR
jgi:hypothetical protein